MKTLRIATRKSALALWQTQHVSQLLQARYPELNIEWLQLSTTGDKVLDRRLAEVGGKALFVKELELAMLADEADIAVHSLKDVPNALPEGFSLAAILERENPCDAFISLHYNDVDSLPQGARVGTSSYRRQAQLLSWRPDLNIHPLRGNVDSRLQKLAQGQYDAIVLAQAGLNRLGFTQAVKHTFTAAEMLPGAGQGAIGIECLTARADLLELLRPLIHEPTRVCVVAERSMNLALEGNCHSPIGSFAELSGEEIILRGLVASHDGKAVLRTISRGSIQQAEKIGRAAAQDLLAQGAGELLC